MSLINLREKRAGTGKYGNPIPALHQLQPLRPQSPAHVSKPVQKAHSGRSTSPERAWPLLVQISCCFAPGRSNPPAPALHQPFNRSTPLRCASPGAVALPVNIRLQVDAALIMCKNSVRVSGGYKRNLYSSSSSPSSCTALTFTLFFPGLSMTSSSSYL